MLNEPWPEELQSASSEPFSTGELDAGDEMMGIRISGPSSSDDSILGSVSGPLDRHAAMMLRAQRGLSSPSVSRISFNSDPSGDAGNEQEHNEEMAEVEEPANGLINMQGRERYPFPLRIEAPDIFVAAARNLGAFNPEQAGDLAAQASAEAAARVPSGEAIIGPQLPEQDISSHGSRSEIGPQLPGVDHHDDGQSMLNRSMGHYLDEDVQLLEHDIAPQQARSAIGPQLPACFVGSERAAEQVDEDMSTAEIEDDDPIDSQNQIGPALPPGFAAHSIEQDTQDEDEEVFGPMPPSAGENLSTAHDEEMEDDDGVIGPMPISAEQAGNAAEEYAHLRLRLEKKAEEEGKPQREDWMVKVPTRAANYGVGARQFKRGSSATAEIDQTWEDTPQAKRNRRGGESAAKGNVAETKRDEEQRKLAEELNVSGVAPHPYLLQQQLLQLQEHYECAFRHRLDAAFRRWPGKNRDESLVDVHMKAAQEEKPQGERSSGERVPFDHDRDMAAGGMKNVSLEEVKERMGNLGSRFASGGGQKFL
ncbi:unnamed protein product [Nippostrongylus brasiliensis]|uniref:DUF3752 domain-containing protein n=1 Tax=Nippostrongylus brasiliensis TaxID=27835 RepID=A0A0N4XWP3_NIPBR|nr:unnamed protein product [Nippostrongylus brasiliensis]